MRDPHSQGPAQNGAMPVPTLLTTWESRELAEPWFPPLKDGINLPLSAAGWVMSLHGATAILDLTMLFS